MHTYARAAFSSTHAQARARMLKLTRARACRRGLGKAARAQRRRARVRDGVARAPLSRRCDRGRRSRMQCNRSVFSMSCGPVSSARRSHPCADWRSPTAATAEATALRSSSATAPLTLTESVELVTAGVVRASRSGSSLANSVTYLQATAISRPFKAHASRQPSASGTVTHIMQGRRPFRQETPRRACAERGSLRLCRYACERSRKSRASSWHPRSARP